MYSLNYAEEADRDLQAIFNYIAEDSAEQAKNYLGKMEKCILQLADFPGLGHESKYAELRFLGIRILPFEDYLIFYAINDRDKKINILRILHGSQNYRPLF